MAAPTSLPASKSHPIPWTHQETINLIQAYQEKWYSLEKGQLKSNQWDDVARTVASLCGYNHFDPSKTSIQCRHKMEKLRQRFRAEKQRLSIGNASYWQYFDLMNNLLRGPLPLIPYDNEDEDRVVNKLHHYNSNYNNSDDEEEEDDEKNCSKSRRISYLMERPIIMNREIGVFGVPAKPGEAEEGDEEVGEGDVEEGGRERERERERESEVHSKLAAEIRLFADKLVGMETKKLEMMRETEKIRMAMESKRIEMILESEQKIVNSIAKAFGSPKRSKFG